MSSQGKIRGVVIEPFWRWRPEKLSTEDEDKLRKMYPDIDWVFTDVNVPNINTAALKDIEDFADRYCSLVKEQKADLLLSSTFDGGALLHSYIANHNPHLKYPSVEAVMLCNSKGYTRKLLIPDQYNVKYIPVLLYPNQEINIDEIVDAVGLPLILKPSCGTASSLIQKCESRDELIKALQKVTGMDVDMRCYYDVWGKLLVGLEEKYEILKTPYLLAEECIGVDTGEATIHTTELCIQNGRVIPCEFVDNLYWKSNPQAFVGCGVPTQLSEAAKQAAAKMRDEVCQRLISYGMDNCLFNIEFFALRDDSVKVLEVNPRMFYQVTDIVKMYYNTKKMQLFFDLQLGNPIPTPKPRYLTDPSAPKYAANLYVVTFETGKATDIFDYEYWGSLISQKREDMTFELLVHKNRVIDIVTNSGVNFCFINISGDDLEDCKRKLKPIFHKLLKNSDKYSVWEDSEKS